ncbi:ADP-ribosylglycohydrolase family protein [Microvirga calopogonii]|uniref:ADP-ribosylglycohydrolase family protein n=1 Tax=Microvirga calopogonii TaxID=2078013 RepID=UPI000E0D0555|nr:ADP-ribosylglycohydrolase family protein [Microvirga calopogonii]
MSSPLRIAEISTGRAGGLIGITFAPGKKQVSAYSGVHDRDLSQDLDTIAAWGAAAVVTLVTARELIDLKIPTLGDEVRSRFMEWHHLPIEDWHAPDAAFEATWPASSRRLRTLLETGNRVLVHCKGGLGRAGMITARLLVEMGAHPEQAMADVRAARSPLAIENVAQEEWVRRGTKILDRVDVSQAAVRDRAVGALVGLAVGDAVGTTLEFRAKPPRAVLFDLVGGGPFRLEPGQFTDDTSMSLALADSLMADPNLDTHDLMNRFVRWWQNGENSVTGECFDIGITTAQALRRFEITGDPLAGSTDPDKAGNGSIMRLAPVAVRHWADRERLLRVARDQSRTTHGAAAAVTSCEILAELLADAIAGQPLSHLISGDAARRVTGFWPGQPRDEVRGTGYVVACLHAALWAVSHTSSFRDAVLLAANLGEDADTTAAVAGQIAGALYGLSGIPTDWLDRLAWRGMIESKAECLFRASLAAACEEDAA